MRQRWQRLLGLILSLTLFLAACGGGAGDGADDSTVKVAYLKFGAFEHVHNLFREVKPEFEEAHPGTTLELVPIEAAADTEYHNRLALMQRSESTAPDVAYVDSFLINSDVEAGYLAPLDEYLQQWDGWDQYVDTAKEAGLALDGHTYGVLLGTDTRGLWYNQDLLRQAGIQLPWEPKSWDDVLAAARQVKQNVPDVIPLNVYSGTPMGEASSMQGFQMLLYGTPGGTLFNPETKKWVASSPGITDSLEFIDTVFSEELGPSPQQALNPNFGNRVSTELIPGGKLAIALDGSWMPQSWNEASPQPWPEWEEVMAVTPMPTQNGQEPGAVSMSGGWTLAISSKSGNPDMAWEFIEMAASKDNSLQLAVESAQLAVRKDVATDPAYLEYNPTVEFWTDLVEVTNFRPAYGVYPKISAEIQKAMEAVMTGQATPQEAAESYATAVRGLAGENNAEDAG